MNPSSLSAFFLAIFAGSAAATMYCQCENPSQDRVFPGINQVCNQLGGNWCSTNCNIAGYNCDYCEWIPAGPSPDNDYSRLKSWCFGQNGYNYGTQTSYKGTDVFCYSNNAKAYCGSCGGCSYHSNSFYKRGEELTSKATGTLRRSAYNGDPDREAPNASVTLNVEPLEGVDAIKRDCLFLYPEAAQEMSDELTENNDCRIDVNEGNQYDVTCSSVEGIVDGLLGGFSKDCNSYGGHEDDGLAVKRAEDVRVHFMD